jgi:hypothetical protein
MQMIFNRELFLVATVLDTELVEDLFKKMDAKSPGNNTVVQTTVSVHRKTIPDNKSVAQNAGITPIEWVA